MSLASSSRLYLGLRLNPVELMGQPVQLKAVQISLAAKVSQVR